MSIFDESVQSRLNAMGFVSKPKRLASQQDRINGLRGLANSHAHSDQVRERALKELESLMAVKPEPIPELEKLTEPIPAVPF